MFEVLTYEVQDGVARIALNRPQVMNAMNTQLSEELYAALKAVDKDNLVRAVVLTGEGRAFCAGQDLGDTGSVSHNLADSVRERYNLIVAKMQTLQKPVIAAINGTAAGAGFGLALACDLRLASRDAKFTMAFNKIGLVPDSGCSYFFPRLVGMGKALEWAFSGELITAEELHQCGAINRLCDSNSLMDEAMAYAKRLAQGPTLAYGLTKRAMYENVSATLYEALEKEATLQMLAGRSYDFREGVQAFLEKRPPNYEGR